MENVRHEISPAGINQPYTSANVPTGPVVDQNKKYLRVEVTLSQPYYEYIKRFQYYDADIQTQAVWLLEHWSAANLFGS